MTEGLDKRRALKLALTKAASEVSIGLLRRRTAAARAVTPSATP